MQTKDWRNAELARAGAAVALALQNLERGQSNEVDIELGSGEVRVISDLANGRVVVFDLSNLREQRKWH